MVEESTKEISTERANGPSVGVRCVVFVLLLVSLGLVAFPRFNRQDIWPLKAWVGGRAADGSVTMGDAPEYIKMVRYYRGETPRHVLSTPFVYRPAVPWLAALLPVRSPMTALNLVNLAGLVVAVLCLHGLLRTIGYGFWWAVVANGLFIVSFPVFYYGTIGLIDPAWMSILIAGMLCLYREKWLALCALMIVGAWVRETTVWLLPVAAVYVTVARVPRGWLKVMAVGAAYLLSALLIRVAYDDLPQYVWCPSWRYFYQNCRVRAVIAMLLSFGVPGALMLCWRGDKRVLPSLVIWAPMLVGVLVGMGLTAFAFVSAYADGRFMWGASVFALPFAVDVLARAAGIRAADQEPPVKPRAEA